MRFEPSLHLVDLTHDAALIAWGGFWLEDRDGMVWVVDDDDLERPGGSIGASSPAYGHAVVEVVTGGDVVSREEVDAENHVWVRDLEPDTAYSYRVAVDGERWVPDDITFRTHPAEDAAVHVSFAAIGDYGVGIVNGEAGERQAAVARTLEWLAAHKPLRCVLGLGDNIYGGEEDRLQQSGDEDDDWYFTFYEPYRRVIDRLPFYPAAGNHDGADEEASDDRRQLEDNFHLHARFEPRQATGRASLDPGLFYRLRLGALVDLICVDTSWGAERGEHWFDDDEHLSWLTETLADVNAATWKIPFCHHPAWCAGPNHDTMTAQVESLVPLYRDGGVRIMLHGHEHNLQHGCVDGLHYIVSGAGGKLDTDHPTAMAEASTLSWAAEAHCLLVEVDEERVVVTPYAGMAEGDAEPRVVTRLTPDGVAVADPIVIERSEP